MTVALQSASPVACPTRFGCSLRRLLRFLSGQASA